MPTLHASLLHDEKRIIRRVILYNTIAGKVVVLVAEGSEESKLRNSNSKSKSITKALQTRKDKFEMFKGDDPMVPPGPRPRRVEQEMVIVEYHLSQVWRTALCETLLPTVLTSAALSCGYKFDTYCMCPVRYGS